MKKWVQKSLCAAAFLFLLTGCADRSAGEETGDIAPEVSEAEQTEPVAVGEEAPKEGPLESEGELCSLPQSEALPKRRSECDAIRFESSSLLEPGGGVFEMAYTEGHENETWYYDEFYCISRYSDGEWQQIPMMYGFCGMTDCTEVGREAPELQEFDWSILYGALEPGVYCLTKEVFPGKESGDGPDLDRGVPVHAVFELKDSLGLSLLVWGAKPTGLTTSFVLYDEDSGKELSYGSWYRVDRLEDGVWTPVDYVLPVEEVAWTQEARIIGSDASQEEVDWERLYGALPAGRYRFCREVMDFRETGDYDKYLYTAEFMIE